MARQLLKLTSLLLLVFNACTPPNGNSLKSIVDLYGGKFSLENGLRVSTSHGKEKYLKIICENNSLINKGWLSPESMANNCAALFVKSNPQIIKERDLLEVEISNTGQDPYAFKTEDINSLIKDYSRAENIIIHFVDQVKNNDFTNPKTAMETSPNISDSDLSSFLQAFKNTIPQNFKETKLLGYRKLDKARQDCNIDFVLIAKDETQKMINATLVSTDDGLKFREIKL